MAWSSAFQAVVVSIALLLFLAARFAAPSLSAAASSTLLRSPGWVAFVSTVAAEALARLSASLLSRSLLRWLAIRIRRPTNLFLFHALLHLSRAQALLRRSHLALSFATVALAALLGSLTASWATLLTPTQIAVSTPIEGLEIDIASPAFNALLNSSTLYHSLTSALRSNDPTAFGSLLVASGVASAYSHLGIRRLLQLDHALFNRSTAGILPIGALDIGVGANSRFIQQNLVGGPLTSTSGSSSAPLYESSTSTNASKNILRLTAGSRDAIQSNHTIIQQGLTARLSCAHAPKVSQWLQAATQTISFPVSNQSTSDHYTLTKFTYNATCPNGQKVGIPSTLMASDPTVSRGGMVTVATCKNQNVHGQPELGTHLLVISGTGSEYSYLRPTLCPITLRLTTVSVDYQGTIEVSQELSSTPLPESASVLTDHLLDLVQAGIRGSQNIFTNTFGDGIRSVYSMFESLELLDTHPTSHRTLLDPIIQAYVQGQVEFIASYLKSVLARSDAIQNLSMTKVFAGHGYPTRMGWDQRSGSSRYSNGSSVAALIPILLVGLLSTLASINSRKMLRSESFNASSTSDLTLGQLTPPNPQLAKITARLRGPNQGFKPDDLIQLMNAARAGNLKHWIDHNLDSPTTTSPSSPFLTYPPRSLSQAAPKQALLERIEKLNIRLQTTDTAYHRTQCSDSVASPRERFTLQVCD